MSRTKKFLGLVMALVMMLGCFTMAFAAGETASITVTSTATELEPGATANITVAATTNFTVGTLSVPVFYNKTLVDVSAIAAPATNIGDATIVTDANSAYADKVFANTGLDRATYGFILVTYIPEGAATLAANLSSAAVLTFTVTAKADVEGDAVITVPAGAQKTTSNMNGTLYMGASKDATLINSLTNVEGINVSGATATIAIGASEPNTLIVKESFECAGDVIIDKEVIGVYLDWYGDDYSGCVDASATGLVYGVEVFDFMLTDALTTTLGDDYLRVTQTEAAGDYDATMSKIEVLDADGSTVLETYYFVYFGDINCDGLLDGMDLSEEAEKVNSLAAFDTITQFIASDCNADTFTDGMDVTDMKAVVSASDMVDQAALAAAFYEEYHAAL